MGLGKEEVKRGGCRNKPSDSPKFRGSAEERRPAEEKSKRYLVS